MAVKIEIMKLNSILFITLLIIFSGCKINEAYKNPILNEPSTYYGKETNTLENNKRLVDVPWRNFFKDSLLITLIDTAFVNNIDLLITDQYIEIQSANFKQAKAGLLPSVSADPYKYRSDRYSENFNNYGSNRSRRNHGDNPPQSLYTERLDYESSIQFNWELDVWGKLQSQKRIKQLSYMKTTEFKKTIQTSLIADIASTYAYLLLLKSKIEVYERNLALNDNTLRIVKLQYEANEVTSLAVKQTQSQKLRAQTLIPQLEKEYTIQENYLNRLIGRYPTNIDVKSTLEWEMIKENYVAGMPLELLKNRPDIAASEYNLKASYEKVGMANAMRYPSVNIGASVGLNSLELDKLLNPIGSGFLLMNGAIFQPIFQNRKLKTNYEIALSEKRIAELEFKNVFLKALNEVSDVLVTIEKLKEEYSIAQERVLAAHNAVKDASFLFKSGLANYLEVITAQSEALESELNLENVKMQIIVANIELYRSLGGGWK